MSAALPHSLEAEETVVGAVLLHPRVFVEAAAKVSATDFHHPALGAIWSAMGTLDAASKPIDAVTVLAEMQEAGTAGKLGAIRDGLTGLAARVVTVENIAYHAQAVRRKAERRRWMLALSEVVAAGRGDASDSDFFSLAEQQILALSAAQAGDHAKPFKQVMRSVVKALEERVDRQKQGQVVQGISTGLVDVDSILGGLRRGRLYILAARPSMGKSAMAGALLLKAVTAGHPGLLFSLEMADEEQGERLLANDSGVSGEVLQGGHLSMAQWISVHKATERIADLPLWIDDSGTLSIADVRSRARRWRMRECKGTREPVVAVDYMQLLRGTNRDKGSNREQEIAEISRGLKALAKELDCPVLALSQLNRSVESRADKRPMMSDLRESGAIEQDCADVVTFLYRDEVYNKDTDDKGVAEFIVGKQRMGRLGTARLAWRAELSRFDNLAQSSRHAPPTHWTENT